ncbi:MAG: right-handed parallel beta-helix repeat-containing protein [Candidatus Thermoplasmatota archaeon]|nr:right-handed parallel beta-helix repeat-containing protein [Candidatus Thermoplasmatota archaeon]
MKLEVVVLGIVVLFIGSCAIPTNGRSLQKSQLPFQGHWLYVGGVGPGNYSTIQDAIDNASDGDTVFVFHGTYVGHVNINKSLTLIGEDKYTTVISGFMAYTVSIISDQVTMRGFTIQNGGRLGEGVRIDSCYTTFNNNVVDIPKDDIRLVGDNNIISDNIITANIFYLSGNGNIISTNSITNFYYGIFLTNAWESIISNNSFFNSGLFFSDNVATETVVINNTVNDKTLVFLDDEVDLIVHGGAGQIILMNCTNITVKDQEILDTTVGIQIIESATCFISNNLIAGNQYGISHLGWNNIIKNNIIIDNNNGVLLSGEGNTISDNTISNNSVGIYCDDSTKYNCIVNNTVIHNFFGMQLDFGSDCNTISSNTILNNTYGIRIGSIGNCIYQNNLIQNTQNAYDSSLNTWYNADLHQGNFWSDYSGGDLNHDGIGDTPYNITGGTSQDTYPLIHPYGETDLVIRFVPHLFNSELTIQNTGVTTAFSINWTFLIEGGPLLFCKGEFSGGIRSLLPGEGIVLPLRFLFFGLGAIKIHIWGTAENAPVVETTIHGFLFLFLFLIR